MENKLLGFRFKIGVSLIVLLVFCQNVFSQVLKTDIVDSTFSDFAVPMRMFTAEKDKRMRYQYVVYYDKYHNMCIASRTGKYNKKLGQYEKFSKFKYVRLNSVIENDSHNYTTVFVDSKGYVHVSGNMHSSEMNYWRTEKPYDIRSIRKVTLIPDGDKKHCSYPCFFLNRNTNELMFTYRDGGSGNGDLYLYVFKKGRWEFVDVLFAGKNSSDNNYVFGLVGEQPQDLYNPYTGYYELLYLWRETPNASTCKRLCYVRTRDFRSFENSKGEPVKLPLTSSTTACVIDDVPVNGGLLNTCWRMCSTSFGTFIVYHKYDSNGDSQLYSVLINSAENKMVGPTPLTRWKKGRYEFGGGGSGPDISGWVSFEIGKEKDASGKEILWLQCSASFDKNRRLIYDTNLDLIHETKPEWIKDYPESLMQKENPNSRNVHVYKDLNNPKFFLRYESYGANRDMKREGIMPHSSLKVIEIK